MAIVCGIDFTPSSLRAAASAARLAARRGMALHLVHAVDAQDVPAFRQVRDETMRTAEVALRREAERLAADIGGKVEPHLRAGKADVELVRYAKQVEARMVVIAALGNRPAETWLLGGSAERIAHAAPMPVLVLRDTDGFDEWLGGRRPLEITVAVDRTQVGAQSLALAGELRQAAPCNVTVLHLYWAADEFNRLGMSGVRSVEDRDPEVERVLRRDFEARLEGLAGTGEVTLRLELAVGRASDQIVDAATRAKADLLVVGMHRRNLADRIWSGSTSRAVLHRARCSVASVLEPESPAVGNVPHIGSVLVATDLSTHGNAAVPWACAILPSGGVVHLLHVAELGFRASTFSPRDLFDGPWSPEEQEALRDAEQRLRALVPSDAPARGVTVRPLTTGGVPSAGAILQAAERLGVDAIVLGTRARTGVKRALLGSVAQEVAMDSPRPVLLVHGMKLQSP